VTSREVVILLLSVIELTSTR